METRDSKAWTSESTMMIPAWVEKRYWSCPSPITTPQSAFSKTAVLLDTLRSKKIGYLGLDVYRPARVHEPRLTS